MKFFLLVLFIFLQINSFTQNHIFGSSLHYGSAVSKDKILNNKGNVILNKKYNNNIYDIGFNFSYSKNIWKKKNLFLSTMINMAQNKNIIGIYSGNSYYLLDDIIQKKERLGIGLGLGKVVNLNSEKISLKLDIYFYYKFYSIKETKYSSETKNYTDYPLTYSYNLVTNYEKHPSQFSSLNINVAFQYKISTSFSFLTGINLLTNIDYFYDLTYKVTYYESFDLTTPVFEQNFHPTINIKNNYVNNNLFNLNIGFSYNLGK